MSDATPFTETFSEKDYEIEAIAWVNTAIVVEQSDDYTYSRKYKMVAAYASIANVYATLALAKAHDEAQKS